MPYALAIHGGAGLIRRASLSETRRVSCEQSLARLVAEGERALQRGDSARDVVTQCVVELEDDPLFNAGRGAVYCAAGHHEFDAALMCGARGEAGAVGAVRSVRNAILLARHVLEETPHVLLVGEPARELARAAGLILEDDAYFRTEERWRQFLEVRDEGRFTLDHGSADDDVYGTVGAVACDQSGHVAAATSTGGMVNKAAGRVGDTPIIGGGTYASNQSAAISATGHGEAIMRQLVAARVAHEILLSGRSLADAVTHVVHGTMREAGAQGGLIAVNPAGEVAMAFNTGGMFRAAVTEGGQPEVAIW